MFADIATEASKGSQMDTKDMRHQTALSVLNPHASLNNVIATMLFTGAVSSQEQWVIFLISEICSSSLVIKLDKQCTM